MLRQFSLGTLLFCSALSLQAKPAGGRVVSGDALIDPSLLYIQTGPKAIIEWNSFSVDAAETLQFVQPDAHSVVLNRVMGPDASALLGALVANGKVYVINPNGVLIGPNARIETASFVASSLDILNADFLADHLVFAGNSFGSVINLGHILCPSGSVALIARKVTQAGQIEAPRGKVGLASGLEVLLQPEGEEMIFIRPSLETPESVSEETAAIEQSGSIQALTIELKSLDSPYAKAIHHSGNLSADTVSEEGGKVYLVAEGGLCEVSGQIQAQGLTGGQIHVLGKEIRLIEEATLDASGIEGGGVVLVGGDVQGKNPTILNAQSVWVGPLTKTGADAFETGNGGKVVFWSDETTSHFGKISIRGGSLQGDGGFAEVSGNTLEYKGYTDGKAPFGKPGTLLLDPNDIVIGASATTGSFTACPGSTYTITTGTATNQILNTDLVTQLESCSVTISTVGSAGSGPNSGSITVSSAVSWTAATTLTLDAASFISLSAAITNTSSTTGFTALQMNAAPTANATSAITIGANITTDGGDILATGVASGTTGACHGITITSSSAVTSGAGNIRLMGVGGASSTASHGFSIPASTSGRVVSTSGTISIAGSASGTAGCAGVSSISTTAFVSSTSGNINISGTSTATGNSSSGVTIGTSWAPATSGTVTFGSSITDGVRTISGCQATAGLGSTGLALTTYTCPSGTTIGTNNIIGGAGSNCSGFFASTIQSGGPLQITASSQATSSTGHGINIGTLQSPTSGTTRLIGTASPTSSSSNGVNITTLATNTNGSISLGGISTGSGSIGVSTGAPSGTGTGTISISGTSERTTGVSITGNMSYPGDLIFGSTITDGTVSVTGCQGGSVSSGHGLSIGSTTATVGSLTAINSIIGGTVTGSHGFNLTGALAAAGDGDLLITASTLATGASASHGINIASTASISSAGSGTIRLIGTASASNSGSSNGVNLAGTIFNHTGTGAIQVAGSVPSGATGTGVGVLLSSTNPITAQSGSAISISGTSLASGANSHGVSVLTNWTADTTGLITFGSAITDGTVTITGCQGGSGTTSHGISIGAPFSTSGGIIATNSIIGGSGAGSYGFYDPYQIIMAGSDSIAITASTLDSSSTGLLLGNDLIADNGSIALSGTVTLNDSVVLDAGSLGGDVTITGSVTGAGKSLSLNTGRGAAQISGAVNLSSTNGGSLVVQSYSTATFGDTINASGTTNGGSVSLSSSHGSVIVSNINTSGSSGIGGSITLQPSTLAAASSVGLVPRGTIQLNGTSLNASGGTTGGAISLAPAGRITLPTIATIYGSHTSNNSVTFTGASLAMGSNEAMTVFGDITINVTGGAVVSDIVALNTLSISASTIFLIPRSTAVLLAYDGTLYSSTSSHLLSGNTPVFSTSVVPSGSTTGVSGANEAALVYTTDNYALNYDTGSAPTPPTPTPTPSNNTTSFTASLKEQIVYELVVANAQMFDLLPLVGSFYQWPYRPTLCSSQDLGCGQEPLFSFPTFLLENRIH